LAFEKRQFVTGVTVPAPRFKRQTSNNRNSGAVVVTNSSKASWFNVARGALAATLLAVAGGAADHAVAEIIKKEDTLRGITMTREECAARPQTVWLNVYGRDFCVRYYLSTAGGQGARPVVFLNGDSNGPISPKGWTWTDLSAGFDVDTDDLMRTADRFSKMAKTTAIYLGRIGVEGTSGNHLSRKTLLELNLMNMALDAIKQRYRFEGFHLVGQSGGSMLAFGLATMRRDLTCVISGSGRLGANSAKQQPSDPGKAFFQVMGSARMLAQNGALRMMMITDPNDQAVPAAQQTPMAQSLRQAGRAIPQFFVEATDPKHHAVVDYGVIAMAGCVLGRSDADIARAVETLVRRNAEINRRQQDEARAKNASQTAFGTMRRAPGNS
jgi:dienelactone hydrolase